MKVELLAVHGDDLMVANAARVSVDKRHPVFFDNEKAEADKNYKDALNRHRLLIWQELPWWKRKPVKEEIYNSDEKLLGYLAKEGHNSPFFHPHLTFRVTAPVFVARQLMRSTVGLSISEVSRRYISTSPVYWSPKSWRTRAGNIKQGSGGGLPGWKQSMASLLYRFAVKIQDWTYHRLLGLQVCPEQARAILPVAMMTTWIWTGSLSAFARVCALRIDAHAQQECREIALMIDAHCEEQFPYSWKALSQ
jgi:thymidylate synthase (FAD)